MKVAYPKNLAPGEMVSVASPLYATVLKAGLQQDLVECDHMGKQMAN